MSTTSFSCCSIVIDVKVIVLSALSLFLVLLLIVLCFIGISVLGGPVFRAFLLLLLSHLSHVCVSSMRILSLLLLCPLLLLLDCLRLQHPGHALLQSQKSTTVTKHAVCICSKQRHA